MEDRWPLTGACPAINNKYRIVTKMTINQNPEIWYCYYCKIIVDVVKLINENKIQRLLIGFSFGCPLTGA